MDDLESLRKAALEATKTYADSFLIRQEFKAGQTPVPVSGKVLDSSDFVSLVDSSLDGWLTAGRFTEDFQRKLGKFVGARKTLFVNSGYRSPEYNAGLKGAAKNSYHMQGMALDISWSGIDASSREEFVRLARVHGFRGIGRYGPANGNFVHIDIGPERSWSKGI
jgi:hypothetical protein